jgi:hypothetical protein
MLSLFFCRWAPRSLQFLVKQIQHTENTWECAPKVTHSW